MDETSEPNWPRGFDWALVLALATPVAYLWSYRFNVGYLEHFGLPSTFVDIAVKDILYTTAVVLTVGYFVYIFLDFFLVFLPEKWPKKLKRRATLLFMMSIAVAYVLIMEKSGWIAWAISIALFILGALFIAPLRKTDDGSAQTTTQPDPYAAKGVLPGLMRAGIKREFALAGSLVLMLSYSMKIFGGIVATWTTDYLVYQSAQDGACAVIRVRETDLLCAHFEKNTNQLTGTYRFLDPNSSILSLHKGQLKSSTLRRAGGTSKGNNGQ